MTSSNHPSSLPPMPRSHEAEAPLTEMPPAYVSELAALREALPDETPSWQLVADQPTVLTGPSKWSQPGALVTAAREQLRRDRADAARRAEQEEGRLRERQHQLMRDLQEALTPYLDPTFLDAFEDCDWRFNEYGRPYLWLVAAGVTGVKADGKTDGLVWQITRAYDDGVLLPTTFFVECGRTLEFVEGPALVAHLLSQLGAWLDAFDREEGGSATSS